MKSRHPLFVLPILAAASLLLSTSEASAQSGSYYYQGFNPRLFVGAQLGYDHILNGSMFFAAEEAGGVPNDGARIHLTQPGFNWSVYAGARLTPWIGAELAWDALYHPSAEASDCNYAMIDGIRAALRVHFPTGWNIEPFIRLGLGYYFYGDEFEADEKGLGYSLGLGVNYQPFPVVDVELLLLYRAYYFRGMELASDGDYRCGGGYCPFGDEYVHSMNVAVAFHWNAWVFN